MSAERRRREDSLPSDEWTTDPHGLAGIGLAGIGREGDGGPGDGRRPGGWPGHDQPGSSESGWSESGWDHGAAGRPGGGRAGEAWSAEFHHDARDGRGNGPGDPQLDQDWASSYRFDGTPSDEPWRETSQRGDGSPAAQSWRHDGPADHAAEDDWIDRTQVDQSWRYRSLSDESLTHERLTGEQLAADQAGDDWPGTSRPGSPGRDGRGAGRRASDNWPASTRADEAWRDSSHPGAGRADDGYAIDRYATDPHAAGPFAVGRAAADPFAADPYAADPYAAGRYAAGRYAAGPYAAGPYAAGRYAADYGSEAAPSGTHVVGGRRASDSWLAGTHVDESIPAVGGPARNRLTAGNQSGGGRAGRVEAGGTRAGGPRAAGQRPGDGRHGWTDSDWGEGGRPGGRRRILVSVMAAVAVALAFGAYGLVRLHDASTVALRDASSRPCAAHAGRCHSHSPRAQGLASSSPVNSGTPGSSGSPSAAASTPSTAPSRSAPPSSAPASMPPPTHSAAPPKPTPKPSASASQPSGTASSAAAAQVLALINQARAQQGLPALAISSGLNASSAAHTSVMAGGCGLSHQCPGEPPLGTRLTNAGVQWTSAGENIGEGGPEANNTAAITQMAVGLTQSMLNEQPPNDGHRMNILSSSFRFIGITVVLDSRGTVWMTQDFSG